MNISFSFWQNPTGYSGGRYHAWLLALSLARVGHKVTVWTNQLPAFASDFDGALNTLEISIDPTFSRGPDGADFWVICPHHGSRKDLHFRWLQHAQATGGRVVFVSFETPNWLAEQGMPTRGLLNWIPWQICARASTCILSSSTTGEKYAREWYRGLNQATRFAVCSPPCNELALGNVAGDRNIDVTVFVRASRGDTHKGGQLLPAFIAGLKPETRLVIFGEPARIAADLRETITRVSRQVGVKVRYSGLQTDKEKYALFARTKVVACLSLFEGFGYIPVEARVCGACVVAFDIPIFRELHGAAADTTLVARRDVAAFCTAVNRKLLDPQTQRIPWANEARRIHSWGRTAVQFEAAVQASAPLLRRGRALRPMWGPYRLFFAVESFFRIRIAKIKKAVRSLNLKK